MPIVPSLLVGLVYGLVTTTRPGELGERALRSLYRAFDVAAPPIVLFIAIGMLLAAVKLPGAVSALTPLISAVSPSGAVWFVLVFAVLVPLCLFRGPLNVFGLGAGVAGVLVSGGIYPVPAVVGLMASYNQVLLRFRPDEHPDGVERAVRRRAAGEGHAVHAPVHLGDGHRRLGAHRHPLPGVVSA